MRFRYPLLALLLATLTGVGATRYQPASITPPPVAREFRGAWIATVANIDWPSKPGLTPAAQRAELISLLDRAAQLKINAVVFQVRPMCDALYPSTIEPWSEYLTGTMGQAPTPFYDPLAFAIEEAHRRGLELHAWFNPYRARHMQAKSPVSAGHVSQTRPELVRSYGRYLWLDPGERAVQDYSLSVVMDVVKRYDVDGIHFDDYFYPYAERGADGQELDFPDEVSWKKYLASGGKLSRDDWRRENVNQFIARVNSAIKTSKPWVKFGVSPFGIWRPGHPPQIKGFDQYAKLYADARKWIVNGWADYFAPQLYWATQPPEQSFPVLLNWWNEQNLAKRHIWPGMDIHKSLARKWEPAEIPNQIKFSRQQAVSAGHIHWNLSALLRHTNLQATLRQGLYAEPALVPACEWMPGRAPTQPTLTVTPGRDAVTQASWSVRGAETPGFWVVQIRRDGQWRTSIHARTSASFSGSPPEVVAVTAVARTGRLSPPAVVARQ